MNERKTIFLLFFSALIFRLVHCFIYANEIIPGSDQMQEIMLGRKFASGDFQGVLDTYWAPFYPILIGIASFFIDSPVVPAALVSVLASSLLVPLTYILLLQSYGRREALIAGSIALFFPHLINSVVVVGSENVFIALVLGVLIVTWNALMTGSKMLYLTAGILLGLAYLTRPEAIGYFLYLVLIIIAHSFWRKKAFLKTALPHIAFLLLGFFLFATPYVWYLRNETGIWTVSGKARINTIAGELSTETDSFQPPTANGHIKEFIKYFLVNVVEVQKMFPALFPLLLWLFIGLGLFVSPWGKERLEREIFLILFCLVTIVGYAAAVVQLRYFYVLLPILFGWTARGIVKFAEWLHDTASRQNSETTFLLRPRSITVLAIAVIFLYVLPLNFYMRSSDRRWETSGYEERDAGLWLRQNAKTEPYVFSASRRPVFYAEARQLSPATENIEAIISEIKEQKVDYVFTSERSLKRNTFLKGFDEILRNDSDFELVYEKTPRTGYRICIFKRRFVARQL